MVPKMANALARLGTTKSWIVHGDDGLDEISLSGPTFVAEVNNGKVREFLLTPEEFSMSRQDLNEIRVTNSEESARMIRNVLSGDAARTAAGSVVLMNAAAAVYLAGGANAVGEAIGHVSESIVSGKAMTKLDQLAEAVKK